MDTLQKELLGYWRVLYLKPERLKFDISELKQVDKLELQTEAGKGFRFFSGISSRIMIHWILIPVNVRLIYHAGTERKC